MGKRYRVTNVGKFDFETESGVYDVNVKVDSFGFTTIDFGSSFSIRGNYSKIEQLRDVLQTALDTIQFEHDITDGKQLGVQQPLNMKAKPDNEYLNDVIDW